MEHMVYEKDLSVQQRTHQITVQNLCRKIDSKSFSLFAPQMTVDMLLDIVRTFVEKELSIRLETPIVFTNENTLSKKNSHIIRVAYALTFAGDKHPRVVSCCVQFPYHSSLDIADQIELYLCNGKIQKRSKVIV